MLQRGPQGWRPSALLLAIALLAAGCTATPVTAVNQAPTATAVAPTPAPTPEPVPAPTTQQAEPTSEPIPASEPPPTPVPAVEPTPEPAMQASVADLLQQSTLRAVDCPDDVRADQVMCAVAVVPLNIDAPVAGESVELMLALVDNGDPNNVGPVVFLQGGPGVGSITQAESFVGASHDLVFVDQRGTGYSTPKLNCPEIDAIWTAQFTDDPELRLTDDSVVHAAYASCGARLAAQGIDFDQFNTRAAATDIELIRQLLGHEQWSIWGISYGTRLGLTVMRDHPDGVRAAVLDSMVPFEVDFFATIPENGFRAMTALDQACDAEQCASDHGDFMTNLSELVLRLNETPIVVTATRPNTGEQFPFRVDGEQLIDLVFTQLYSTRALRSLPRQIARAEFGGVEEIVSSFVTRRDPAQFDLSIGLYYTTWCREEFPFYDESTDDALLVDLQARFGDAVAGALSSDGVGVFCDAFAVEPAPASEDEPLTSAIPALVFAGAFDPITPPAWSRQVADALANSTYVEMPNHGHGMATSCPASIRLAFLIDPMAELDTNCAIEAGGPDFD